MEDKRIEELYDIKIAMSMDVEGNPEILTLVQKTEVVEMLSKQFEEYAAIEEIFLNEVTDSILEFTKNLVVLEE